MKRPNACEDANENNRAETRPGVVDSEFKLFKTIEDTLDGLLTFFVRYIGTTCRLFFRPSFIRGAIEEPEAGRACRPYTYLAISILFFAFTVRDVPALFRYPFTVDFEQRLSLSQIVRFAVPSLAVVAALGFTLSFATRPPRCHPRTKFVYLISYVTGCQLFLVSLGLAANTLYTTIRQVGGIWSKTWFDAILLPALVIIWIVCIQINATTTLYLAMKSFCHLGNRFRHLLAILGVLLLSHVTLLTPTLLYFLPTMAAGWIETRDAQVLRQLQCEVLAADDNHNGTLSLEILLTNNHARTIVLTRRSATLTRFHVAPPPLHWRAMALFNPTPNVTPNVDVTSWQDGDAPVLKLAPGEGKWLQLSVDVTAIPYFTPGTGVKTQACYGGLTFSGFLMSTISARVHPVELDVPFVGNITWQTRATAHGDNRKQQTKAGA